VNSGACVLATQHESDKPRGVFICAMSGSATIINSCILDVAEAYCKKLLSKDSACIFVRKTFKIDTINLKGFLSDLDIEVRES
jgi:hypothetical protein